MEKKERTFLLCGLAAIILAPFIKNKIKEIQDLSDVGKLHGPLKIKILEVRKEGRVLAQTLFNKKLIMIDGIPEVYRYDNRKLTAIFNRHGNITITRESIHFIPWKYDSENITLPLFNYEKEA